MRSQARLGGSERLGYGPHVPRQSGQQHQRDGAAEEIRRPAGHLQVPLQLQVQAERVQVTGVRVKGHSENDLKLNVF